MSTTATDQEDVLKLGHGDAQSAKAPARKFAIAEHPDRTLWSPGLFTVLSIGFGAYLGRLREIVNPAPNMQAPDLRQPETLDEAVAETLDDQVDGRLDMAAFWQEIQQLYYAASEQVDPPRRLYSSVRFNAQDYILEGPYAARPFQGVSIDVSANSFRFLSPPATSAGFGNPLRTSATSPLSDRLPASGNQIDGTTTPIDTKPPVDGGSIDGGKQPPVDGGTGGGSQPLNRAPVFRGPIYLGSGLINLSMLLTWADLARAAMDPDGDILTVSDIRATSGEIRTYGSDAWIYVPDRDRAGMITLTFKLSDGKATIEGQAFLELLPHPETEISGTDADDVLLGTPNKDVIDAGAGNDIVYGREDDDLILGGAGDDLLIGGDGRDVIHGGAGNDRIFGGDGDDILFGDAGNDLIFGEAGGDSLMGGAGDDILSGGDGDDRLFGEAGNDVLSGDAGNDVLEGGAGQDTLVGGAGDDILVGNQGDDVFVAGTGPVLELASLSPDAAVGSTDARDSVLNDAGGSSAGTTIQDDGNDILNGGDGSDTYDASSASSAVLIDLEAGFASGEEIGQDRLTSIENAIGGNGNDVIHASTAVNILHGKGGNDTFVFGSVASIANGGTGFDEIRDFRVGDKVDLSKLERELGRLHFDDGQTSLELNRDEYKTLVKLYKKMIDDEDRGHHVLQLATDIDGDQDYEIVIISAEGLGADDLILTSLHLPGQTEALMT